MRPWMIGMVLGMLPVLLLARLPGVWVAVAMACAGLLLLRCGNWPGRFGAGVLMGCSLAVVHGQLLLQHRLPTDCALQPVQLSGRVASLPRLSQMPGDKRRQRFELVVESLHPARCRGPTRVLLSYYGPQKIVPGQRWRFDLPLKRPWGLANPGSYNLQAWFAETGIDALGTIPAARAVLLDAAPSRLGWHHRLRQDISEHIAGLSLAAEVAATLRAITVADKSGIDSGLWTLLQVFGVNHLLVISGLHVGLVAGAGYLLGGAGVRVLLVAGVACSWLPACIALAFAGAYTALAGFSVSTQRALCMLTCFILAGLVGRRSAPANNLLLAAVLILVCNPLAALGSGLWLSFGAVAALLWLLPWQRGDRWRRLLGTHVFMSLVMLPMGAWWFGGASLVAALANLLMVPLVGLVVVPVALVATLAVYLAPAVAPVLWRVCAWPLEQVLPLAARLAADSHGWLYRPLAGTLPEVLLAAFAVALFMLPAGWQLRLLATVLALPLLVLPEPVSTDAQTRVTVLDVGQGTAVLVQAGDRAMLYDTGGGDPAGNNMASAVILPFLRRQGITALDTLVVSHPDVDHSAGTATLLRALAVDRFLAGGDLTHVGGSRPCAAGQAWRWPTGQRFRILSPALEPGLSTNNGSCVLQVDTGTQRLLLAGDIHSRRERELVRYWGRQLRSDWLLVAHHGSLTSSSHAWLKAVRPGIAVITHGYANRFGHPRALVVERMESAGALVYSTVTGGALTFDFAAGRPVSVGLYRNQRRRFWM